MNATSSDEQAVEPEELQARHSCESAQQQGPADAWRLPAVAVFGESWVCTGCGEVLGCLASGR